MFLCCNVIVMFWVLLVFVLTLLLTLVRFIYGFLFVNMKMADWLIREYQVQYTGDSFEKVLDRIRVVLLDLHKNHAIVSFEVKNCILTVRVFDI